MSLVKPARAQAAFGQSASIQNEVLRLQRAELANKKKLEDAQKELASKLHLKKEIEDWFADKVSIEF